MTISIVDTAYWIALNELSRTARVALSGPSYGLVLQLLYAVVLAQ
jgi:hypothetical protein